MIEWEENGGSGTPIHREENLWNSEHRLERRVVCSPDRVIEAWIIAGTATGAAFLSQYVLCRRKSSFQAKMREGSVALLDETGCHTLILVRSSSAW